MAVVIGVVVGPDAWTENTLPERRENTVHEPASTWLGPACNLGKNPAERLIAGQQVEAEAVTCWRCLDPVEAREADAEWERKRVLIRRSWRSGGAR